MARANVGAALAAVLLCMAACRHDHGADIVGVACVPDSIPTMGDGVQGYAPTETYLQVSADACGHHPCIVHRLDNGTDGAVPADPSLLCDASDPAPGCLEASAVAKSVHCTCRCAGPERNADYCTCPADFRCQEVLTTGPKDLQGAYCVKLH